MWSTLAIVLLLVSLVSADFDLKCGYDVDDSNSTEWRCVAVGKSDKPTLFEGDVLINDDSSRNAITSRIHKWPNGMVPYIFHQDFNQMEKERVLLGFRSIEAGSCVKFVPWTGAGVFLLITKEPNCFASVGFGPNEEGFCRLNLESPGCMFPLGLMQHEILHVLGLAHEQSRPDRDQYVQVIKENIAEGQEHNFLSYTNDLVTTYDLPYNYMSVMHYFNNEFSKDPSLPTLVSKKDPKMAMGQRDGVTEDDMVKVRKMYFCDTAPNLSIFHQLTG